MSYNKYFNKTLVSNQSGNILTLDNSNLVLNFKNNINFNINSSQENISFDQIDKSKMKPEVTKDFDKSKKGNK